MAHVRHHHVTIKELQQMGYPVIAGRASIPKEWLPKKPVSLEAVRRRLAHIKGSLAQTVADMRDEES